ncbi:MAG TPA: entericidin A/B family lipoprotein [Candidatus Binatia bacterium]|jgi:predicted small secreted protein
MRVILFAALAATLLSMNIACNTVRGAGQDIERAGEKTQDAATSVQRKL